MTKTTNDDRFKNLEHYDDMYILDEDDTHYGDEDYIRKEFGKHVPKRDQNLEQLYGWEEDK